MLGNISLAAVRAFEAAARLGSFKEAALELHLSSSAVSHAINSLEDALGVALFVRSHRRVTLTADGRLLLRHSTTAFD